MVVDGGFRIWRSRVDLHASLLLWIFFLSIDLFLWYLLPPHTYSMYPPTEKSV